MMMFLKAHILKLVSTYLLVVIFLCSCVQAPKPKKGTKSETAQANEFYPLAQNIAVVSTAEDTPVTAGLLGSDLDDNTLYFSVVSPTGHGSITIDNINTGEFTYTPAPNSYGTHTFTYQVSDFKYTSNIATVNVIVTPVDDPPTLTTMNTLVSTNEDETYTILFNTLLAASDAQELDGDTLKFRIESISSGTLTHSIEGAVTTSSTTIQDGQALYWRPPVDTYGTAVNAFTIVASDGISTTTTAVQVNVQVDSVNDAPTIATISHPGPINTGSTIDISLTIDEGGGSDEDTQEITVTVLSSNTALVPNSVGDPGMVVSFSDPAGANDADTGTLTINPNPNAYGISLITVMASDGITTSSETFAFTVTPFMPTNLKLWLAAEALTDYGDNDSVELWPDISGSVFNASQTAASGTDRRPTLQNNEINSNYPIVRFDGSNDIMTGSMSSFTQGSFFVVFKPLDTSTNDQGIFSLIPPGVGDDSTNEDGLEVSLGDTDGKFLIHRNVGANELLVSNYLDTQNTAQILSYTLNTGMIKAKVNGQDLGFDHYSDVNSIDSDGYVLGARAQSISTATGFSQIDYAEILFFDKPLTKSEESKIINYLSTKYAITVKSDPVMEQVIPKFWLQADSGITKNGIDEITAWADQSGNNNDVTSVVGNPVWTASQTNYRPGVVFDGAGDYVITPSLSYDPAVSGYTAFFVFALNDTGGHQVIWQNAAGTGTGREQLGLDLATADTFFNNMGGAASNDSAAYTYGAWRIYTLNWDGETISFTQDGGFRSKTLSSVEANDGVNVFFSNAGGNDVNGTIAELIFYNQELPLAQRQKIESYLGLKYGIKTFPTSSTELSLWLKADQEVFSDACGGTSATTGSVVACWEDQSGNSNDVSAGTSPLKYENRVNQKPAIYFDGADGLVTGAVSGTTFFGSATADIYSVAKQNSANTQNILVGWGTTNNSVSVGLSNDNEIQLGHGNPVLAEGISSASEPSTFDDQWRLVSLTRDYSVGRIDMDGRNLSTSTYGDTLDFSSTAALNIGASGGGLFFFGDVSELMIYSTPQTITNRARINSYLDEKFNLDVASYPVLEVSGLELWLSADAGIAHNGLGLGPILNGELPPYIAGPDAPNLSMGGNKDFSLATWVELGTKTIDGNILSKWQTGQKEWLLKYDATTDRFSFSCTSDGVNNETSISASTYGSPASNAWVFVAAWYDSSGDTLNIAVNGGATDSVAYDKGCSGGTMSFIPASSTTRVSKVGVWTKVLSGAEITALYNNGAGLLAQDLSAGLQTNLISYWNFNDPNDPYSDNFGTYHLTGLTSQLGATVTAWSDQGPSANDASSASLATAPLWIGNVGSSANSRPVMRFDGVDDQLDITDSASLDLVADFSIFIVLNATTTQNTSANILRKENAVDGYGIQNTLSNDNLYTVGWNDGAAAQCYSSDTTSLTEGSFQIFTSIKDNLTRTTYLNGTLQSSCTGTLASIANSAGNLYLANNPSAINTEFAGDIAEIIIYRNNLSSTDREKIECYLSSKYGLTLDSSITCP